MKHPTRTRFPARAWRLPVLAATVALALAVSAGAAVATRGSTQQPRPADLGIINAYVAGGASSAELGNPLTFVFAAKNFGPGTSDVSIELQAISGLGREAPTSSLSCVLPGGFVINPDGNFCEPGQILSGHRAGSLVLTGVVDGTGDIAVRACTRDLSNAPDPRPGNDCRTLHVQLV
jgi:hypothetical protein